MHPRKQQIRNRHPRFADQFACRIGPYNRSAIEFPRSRVIGDSPPRPNRTAQGKYSSYAPDTPARKLPPLPNQDQGVPFSKCSVLEVGGNLNPPARSQVLSTLRLAGIG